METNRNNFKVVGKSPSINIQEWADEYPYWFAIVERDKEKDGYGWIRYRGSRPYPYSLELLKENGNYDDDLHCDPHDCYEVFAKDPHIPKNAKFSSNRMKEILKGMNQDHD